MPLINIENVLTEKPVIGFGSMGKKIVITTKKGSMGFGLNRIELNTEVDPDLWLNKINEAISQSRDGEQEKPATVIIQKEIVKIPCKYCGQLVDLSKESSCPRCGAKIF